MRSPITRAKAGRVVTRLATKRARLAIIKVHTQEGLVGGPGFSFLEYTWFSGYQYLRQGDFFWTVGVRHNLQQVISRVISAQTKQKQFFMHRSTKVDLKPQAFPDGHPYGDIELIMVDGDKSEIQFLKDIMHIIYIQKIIYTLNIQIQFIKPSILQY